MAHPNTDDWKVGDRIRLTGAPYEADIIVSGAKYFVLGNFDPPLDPEMREFMVMGKRGGGMRLVAPLTVPRGAILLAKGEAQFDVDTAFEHLVPLLSSDEHSESVKQNASAALFSLAIHFARTTAGVLDGPGGQREI